MGLNDTPSSERIHIGFFGRTNAGKSSLVNRITDQDLAIVSDTRGTTTDPVYKAMEILPLGPVVIIDTPGFDDDGILGEKRISRTKLVLNKTDVAVLVVDLSDGIRKTDEELISLFEEKGIPYIIAFNKADLKEGGLAVKPNEICVSSVTGENINRLKEMIAAAGLSKPAATPLISDLIEPGDTVVLVIPIDSSAPKGRIILPQQQVLREILDSHALAYIAQDTDLKELLDNLKTKPKLVVTDSQAFGKVSKTVPEDIMLTSFSILLARHKGFLESAVKGVKAIESLENGDTVLGQGLAGDAGGGGREELGVDGNLGAEDADGPSVLADGDAAVAGPVAPEDRGGPEEALALPVLANPSALRPAHDVQHKGVYSASL